MLSQDRHRSNPSDPTDPFHLELECADLVVLDIVNGKGSRDYDAWPGVVQNGIR